MNTVLSRRPFTYMRATGSVAGSSTNTLAFNTYFDPGTNYLLVAGSTTSQFTAISSISISNSSGLTTARVQIDGQGEGNVVLDVWEVKGKIPGGIQTVTIVFDAIPSDIGAIVLSFMRVNPTTGYGQNTSAGPASSGTASATLACNTGDIMVGFMVCDGDLTATPGTNTTQVYQTAIIGGYRPLAAFIEVAGASDKTISWTFSTTTHIDVMLAVKP